MKKLINLSFIPLNTDVALLVLRVWLGFGVFVKHGIEKITGFSKMAEHFPDPIGIGSSASLSFALVSDAICSILVILGLATRLSASIIIINLFAAFGLLFKFSLEKPHSELAFVYLGGFIVILLAGAGKYSVDNKLK
ncbi:MAG: DoxX family protein [Chitinophagaceae bacterium]|nr:DoxX family protein [Chitinophagaceae bacterium]